jgi:DNA segregation ATPase FtsK/SpoIIIE-like protein
MNKTNKDYFTFNVHNTALVVGQTGSGKTELVRQYMRRLEAAFKPEQMKYVIFDLKVVEFDPKGEGGAKEDYLYTTVRTGTPEDMGYLEELAALAEQRAAQENTHPLIFIYIEECDMAFLYPGRFQEATIKINTYAERANMKLIFSTSRPSPDIITSDFRDSFDLILSGKLASTADEETLGVSGAARLPLHEFIVKEVR